MQNSLVVCCQQSETIELFKQDPEIAQIFCASFFSQLTAKHGFFTPKGGSFQASFPKGTSGWTKLDI